MTDLPPNRLHGYGWLQAAYPGPRWTRTPDLVVLHSGARHPNVARYLHGEIRTEVEAGLRRPASAHFAWDGPFGGVDAPCIQAGCFLQQVSLQREALHCGGSIFRGDRHPNHRSIGIELPGPASASTRPDWQRTCLRGLLQALRAAIPSLALLTAHQWIDPAKRDPGPGVDLGWFEGLGFEVVWG